MYLDTLQVINPPDSTWLSRLRRGHFVYCVKEKCFAKIDWAWEPPDPGCISGHIGIQLCWQHDESWGLHHLQNWFIKADGTGLDGMPLLFPVRDNLPEEESELSPVWVRHVERTLAQILQRLDQLASRAIRPRNKR